MLFLKQQLLFKWIMNVIKGCVKTYPFFLITGQVGDYFILISKTFTYF